MRDINRARTAAGLKSRRATPQELREARQRVKDIDAELRQIDLLPETKNGEERQARYERVLRLREMRDDFTDRFPLRAPRQPNSVLLALVMTVASFLTCAFCAGGFYFAYNALSFNAGPTATTTAFWSDMQTQQYQEIYLNLLATNLRLQYAQPQFTGDATQADQQYGVVESATLVGQSGDGKTLETYTYTVKRHGVGGKAVIYTAKLTLINVNNSWGVKDVGAAIYPTEGGAKPVVTATPSGTPTGTPTGTTTPSATP